MKTLEYDEVDGQQVLELNLICFGWLLSPDQVKLIRKLDKKRVPNYFALYAVEKEEVLSDKKNSYVRCNAARRLAVG